MIPPTDLELMQFADGELDDARAAEIAAFLGENEEARAVVSALRALGADVRAAAEKPVDVDVTDDVMAAIARLEAASRNAASIPPPSIHRSVRPTPTPIPAPRARVAPQAAILGVLALAAGLFVYSRASLPETTTGPVASYVPAVEALPFDQGDDRPPGAEIDAVDFGGAQGAIFYVPGQANTATAVVWIAEEAP